METADGQRAGAGRQQSIEVVHERGLARAARADQHRDFTWVDVEGEIAQGPRLIGQFPVVDMAQAARRNKRRSRWGRFESHLGRCFPFGWVGCGCLAAARQTVRKGFDGEGIGPGKAHTMGDSGGQRRVQAQRLEGVDLREDVSGRAIKNNATLIENHQAICANGLEWDLGDQNRCGLPPFMERVQVGEHLAPRARIEQGSRFVEEQIFR